MHALRATPDLIAAYSRCVRQSRSLVNGLSIAITVFVVYGLQNTFRALLV